MTTVIQALHKLDRVINAVQPYFLRYFHRSTPNVHAVIPIHFLRRRDKGFYGLSVGLACPLLSLTPDSRSLSCLNPAFYALLFHAFTACSHSFSPLRSFSVRTFPTSGDLHRQLRHFTVLVHLSKCGSSPQNGQGFICSIYSSVYLQSISGRTLRLLPFPMRQPCSSAVRAGGFAGFRLLSLPPSVNHPPAVYHAQQKGNRSRRKISP